MQGLWKIPTLFWVEAPFSTLSGDEGPVDTPLPEGSKGGSDFLAPSPPDLGSPSPGSGHCLEPGVGAD